jgi:hypothetical protein
MVLVSLGSNCAVAYQLEKLKLRNQAYPFDWAKIKLPSLIEVLSSDFSDYEKLSIEKYSSNHFALADPKLGSYILTNKYGISFAHELVADNNLENFISTQLRRIERFKQLENPTFIRLETANIPKSYSTHYQKLCEILSGLFGNFKLIVISNKPITHEKIHWVPLEDFDSDWTYSKLNWNQIFNLENN